MTMLSWAVVGLAVGLVSRTVSGGRGLLREIIIAVVGAIIGGWLFVALTGAAVTQLSPASTLVALAGAVLFVALARGLTEGRTAI